MARPRPCRICGSKSLLEWIGILGKCYTCKSCGHVEQASTWNYRPLEDKLYAALSAAKKTIKKLKEAEKQRKEVR